VFVLVALLCGVLSSVVDVRSNCVAPCTPHEWEYLEVDSNQQGTNFIPRVSPLPSYAGARSNAALIDLKGNDILLFGGLAPGSQWLAETWLYTQSTGVWRFVDSSGDGATNSTNIVGVDNGNVSYPGARFGFRWASVSKDIAYIFGEPLILLLIAYMCRWARL